MRGRLRGGHGDGARVWRGGGEAEGVLRAVVSGYVGSG